MQLVFLKAYADVYGLLDTPSTDHDTLDIATFQAAHTEPHQTRTAVLVQVLRKLHLAHAEISHVPTVGALVELVRLREADAERWGEPRLRSGSLGLLVLWALQHLLDVELDSSDSLELETEVVGVPQRTLVVVGMAEWFYQHKAGVAKLVMACAKLQRLRTVYGWRVVMAEIAEEFGRDKLDEPWESVGDVASSLRDVLIRGGVEAA